MSSFSYWNHTAVGYVTLGVLKLDCGVVDPEAREEAFFYLAQNALAGGGWNVGDGDVAGERVGF